MNTTSAHPSATPAHPASHSELSKLRVAVVHDWMFVRRGGEKVLENILEVFPQADVYYLFGKPNDVLRNANRHRFFPSFLANIPLIERFYKWLLPLLPVAVEAFDLTGYDLVISSSSCVAKGAICAPFATHISYIHSPMRYIWDQEHIYFPKKVSLRRPFEVFRRLLLNHMRVWDVTSTHRVRTLIANSHFVAKRCQVYYSRAAAVLPPPVELERFVNTTRRPQQNVLLLGAWVPYKRFFDAAVVLIENGIAVVAAGSGLDFDRLKKHPLAAKHVSFFENPSDAEVRTLLETSGVFLHPAVEDFGITQVEALAVGMPCVAPKRGGSLDILQDNVTGFLFLPDNDDDMLANVRRALTVVDSVTLQQQARTAAQRFSTQAFQQGLRRLVLDSLRGSAYPAVPPSLSQREDA